MINQYIFLLSIKKHKFDNFDNSIDFLNSTISKRAVGATILNAESSRSYVIVSIILSK